MFKTKDGYELELQTPETMKLFGSSKISILKTEIFYTFTQNKSYYQRVVAF